MTHSTSIAALSAVTPKLGETHATVHRLFQGRTLTATEVEAETGIKAHKRIPELVKKGLLREVKIDGVVQTRVVNGRQSRVFEQVPA
jgi:hypothetical protein